MKEAKTVAFLSSLSPPAKGTDHCSELPILPGLALRPALRLLNRHRTAFYTMRFTTLLLAAASMASAVNAYWLGHIPREKQDHPTYDINVRLLFGVLC